MGQTSKNKSTMSNKKFNHFKKSNPHSTICPRLLYPLLENHVLVKDDIYVLTFFYNQELPESQRTDAVNSMVYEAGARMRDPVYGCAGAIYHLQRQVSELQAQLAKTQVELVGMQLQRSSLLELIYNMEQTKLSAQEQGQQKMSFESSFESGDEFISSPDEESNDLGFLEDNNNNNSSMSWWDPLWT